MPPDWGHIWGHLAHANQEMPPMSLTDVICRKAKPKAKTYRLFDGGGLYLEVAPSGSKWWRLKYRFAGKENRLAFGVYPDVSLASAREKRSEARELLANDINPTHQHKANKTANAERNANSFEVVTREWIEVKGAEWAESTKEKIVARMEKDILPYIGARPVSEITAPDLLQCLRRIESRGTIDTAHRALTECGGVLRYAVATGRVTSDPSRDLRGALKKATSTNFAALTKPDDVSLLMRAIETYRGSPVVRAALKFSALVFQRPGEIRHMQWDQIDWDACEWRYVVSKTKKQTTALHVVPLSAQCIAILKDLQPLTGHRMELKPDAPHYVFHGARSRLRPISENTVRLAIRNMGYTDEQMTAHGFRAMARSLLAELGWNESAIERQLSHKPAGPLGTAYDRGQFAIERRKMMQAWADYLDALRDGRNVIAGKFGKVA